MRLLDLVLVIIVIIHLTTRYNWLFKVLIPKMLGFDNNKIIGNSSDRSNKN